MDLSFTKTDEWEALEKRFAECRKNKQRKEPVVYSRALWSDLAQFCIQRDLDISVVAKQMDLPSTDLVGKVLGRRMQNLVNDPFAPPIPTDPVEKLVYDRLIDLTKNPHNERKYSDDFKIQFMVFVTQKVVPQTVLCRALNLSASVLQRWKQDPNLMEKVTALTKPKKTIINVDDDASSELDSSKDNLITSNVEDASDTKETGDVEQVSDFEEKPEELTEEKQNTETGTEVCVEEKSRKIENTPVQLSKDTQQKINDMKISLTYYLGAIPLPFEGRIHPEFTAEAFAAIEPYLIVSDS